MGQSRIDATLGFTEVSRPAQEIGACYGQLRQAELRRGLWGFAIKKAVLRPIDTDTMALAPSLWVESATYFKGSIVNDDQGNPWESVIPDNLGYQPQNTPAWRQYFGPMAVSAYDSAIAYQAGELAYTAPGDGTNRVFRSLVNGNSDNPATATAFDSAATYAKNQVVTYLSVAYMSLIDLNFGNIPSASPALFDIAISYNLSDTVRGSDGVIYSSLGSGNTGHDPVSDAGAHWFNTGTLAAWSTDFVGGAGSLNWLEIGGSEFPNGATLATLTVLWPLGAGPASRSATRNVFMLPANFLRKAPQDPKAGLFSMFGAPTNAFADDWLIESGYIVTGFSDAITLRFVADVSDVRLMDSMFCEGLAAKIAFEVVETLTQSTAKRDFLAKVYTKAITDARLVGAIEQGAVEEPLDELIRVRA